MLSIWRFPFKTADEVVIEMPINVVKFLHVAVQNGQPCLWVLLKPGERKDKARFRVYGTGHPIDKYDTEGNHMWNHNYVGTYFEGSFVFHLFHYIRLDDK